MQIPAVPFIFIMSACLSLLGCSQKEQPYQTAEIYDDLRNRVLGLDPNAMGIQQDGLCPDVWGVVMETGYPEAVATLVALGDGTVSMYFSNGGGMIGVGQHEQAWNAAKQLLIRAQGFTQTMTATTQFPLPRRGHTRFYLLTFAGVVSAEVETKALGNNRHELTPLFYQAHDLIMQVRLADEAAQAEAEATGDLTS